MGLEPKWGKGTMQMHDLSFSRLTFFYSYPHSTKTHRTMERLCVAWKFATRLCRRPMTNLFETCYCWSWEIKSIVNSELSLFPLSQRTSRGYRNCIILHLSIYTPKVAWLGATIHLVGSNKQHIPISGRHYLKPQNIDWWVVSTHLKNASQNGNLPIQVGMIIKHIWNHHLDWTLRHFVFQPSFSFDCYPCLTSITWTFPPGKKNKKQVLYLFVHSPQVVQEPVHLHPWRSPTKWRSKGQ